MEIGAVERRRAHAHEHFIRRRRSASGARESPALRARRRLDDHCAHRSWTAGELRVGLRRNQRRRARHAGHPDRGHRNLVGIVGAERRRVEPPSPAGRRCRRPASVAPARLNQPPAHANRVAWRHAETRRPIGADDRHAAARPALAGRATATPARARVHDRPALRSRREIVVVGEQRAEPEMHVPRDVGASRRAPRESSRSACESRSIGHAS